MGIALTIFGIVFAAFYVWVAVRFVRRRERWALWTLVALVCLPVLYVASFGPVCWIVSRLDANWALEVYRPLGWVMWHGEGIGSAMARYVEYGIAKDRDFAYDEDGSCYLGHVQPLQ